LEGRHRGDGKALCDRQDPIVRVRIGDTRQKMNQKSETVKEYVRAADLCADKGFVVKTPK
jgi:hypothetical protein